MAKPTSTEEMTVQAAKIFLGELEMTLLQSSSINANLYIPILRTAATDFNSVMWFTENYILPYRDQILSSEPVVSDIPGLSQQEFTPRMRRFCLFFLNIYSQCQKS